MSMSALCANFVCVVTRSVCPAILLVFVWVARTVILCRCCVLLLVPMLVQRLFCRSLTAMISAEISDGCRVTAAVVCMLVRV